MERPNARDQAAAPASAGMSCYADYGDEMQYAHKQKSHRPRGTMCQQCTHAAEDCSALDFQRMQVVGKDRDGMVVVKCSGYEKAENYKRPNSKLSRP